MEGERVGAPIKPPPLLSPLDDDAHGGNGVDTEALPRALVRLPDVVVVDVVVVVVVLLLLPPLL